MAEITHHVTVMRDGFHNAFTDLHYWQGCYWVSYRKGSGHMIMDGQAMVSFSSDRTRFREVAQLKAPGDVRGPKMLPVSDDKIALYCASLTNGRDNFDSQQYIWFSNNGYDWGKPQPILDPHQRLYLVRKHEGRFYGLIYYAAKDAPSRHPRYSRLDLMVSDDMLNWDFVSQIGHDEHGINESDIFWRPNGEAWVIARSETTDQRAKRGESQGDYFCSAPPPYTDWTVTEMSTRIHAARILEHEGELYVTGRRFPEIEGDLPSPKTMGVWRVVERDLELVLRVPATGDCSYPGFIKDPEGRICLSYYSTHAYTMGVITPPLRMADHNQPDTPTVADVYFAELQLP